MNEQDELEHVANCLVEMRKAEEAKLKEFGFTWTTLKAARKKLASAAPKSGIEIGKYVVVRDLHRYWIAPKGAANFTEEESLTVHEKRS